MKNKINFIVHNKCNFLSRIEVVQILCLLASLYLVFMIVVIGDESDDTLFEKSNFICKVH